MLHNTSEYLRISIWGCLACYRIYPCWKYLCTYSEIEYISCVYYILSGILVLNFPREFFRFDFRTSVPLALAELIIIIIIIMIIIIIGTVKINTITIMMIMLMMIFGGPTEFTRPTKSKPLDIIINKSIKIKIIIIILFVIIVIIVVITMIMMMCWSN